MRYLIHAVTIIASFLAIYLEEQFLSDYRIEIIGFLILSYFAITLLRRKYQKQHDNFGSSGDIFIVNTTVFLLILATGDISSPIFFLTYFLCFGITFIFEPLIVFLFAICAALIFLPMALENQSVESFVKIGSIIIVSPLGFFFGREFKNKEKLAKKVKESQDEAKNISTELEEVLKQEKHISKTASEKVNDAIKRTKNL